MTLETEEKTETASSPFNSIMAVGGAYMIVCVCACMMYVCMRTPAHERS